jgi:hypothetical protein
MAVSETFTSYDIIYEITEETSSSQGKVAIVGY